jgi:hypothetical protein
MSVFKFILPFITEFLFIHKGQSGAATDIQVINLVTGVVKKELSSMILKIAVALVATSLLIYSLIILTQYLHAYMLVWENGPLFSVLFFSGLSAVCLFAVYKLFGEQEPVSQIFENKGVANSLGLDKVLNNFLEGLTTGMQQAQQQHEFEKKEAEVKVYQNQNQNLTNAYTGIA